MVPARLQLVPNTPDDVVEVQVSARYKTADGSVDDGEQLSLSKQNRSLVLPLRLRRAGDPVSFTPTVFYADGASEVLPALTLPNDQATDALAIGVPPAGRVNGDILLVDALGELTKVIVDYEVRQATALVESKSVELSGAGTRQTFSVRLPDRNKPGALRWRQRLLYADGGVETQEWQDAATPNLIAGVPSEGVLVVNVRYVGAPPSTAGLAVVVVQLGLRRPGRRPGVLPDRVADHRRHRGLPAAGVEGQAQGPRGPDVPLVDDHDGAGRHPAHRSVHLDRQPEGGRPRARAGWCRRSTSRSPPPRPAAACDRPPRSRPPAASIEERHDTERVAMLSFFDSFTVPDLPKFTIHCDDEKPDRYYVVPSEPRLARDEDGRPLLDLMIYARDADKLPPEDLEAQRGWVAVSVELGMTDEEAATIRDYIKSGRFADRRQWFRRFFRFGGGDAPEPKISLPPEWVGGTAALQLPAPGGTSTLVTSRPSLLGTNVVTLSGDLSQDASELLRRSVLAGGLPMTATYQDLTYVARIPAITVEIHGDRSAFLSETIKKYQVTHSQLNSTTVDLGFIEWTRSYWSSWTENHSTLSEFSSETQTITMKVDAGDFRTSPEATAALAKFEEMALNIFSTNVVPSIMRDVSAQFQAAKDALNGPADTPPPPTQISTLTQSITGSVDLNLSKSAVIQVVKNPNGMVAKTLTADEIKSVVDYVDLSDPYFKELRLRVQANVNFESDPVFRLTVTVLYDEVDASTGQNRKGSKTFAFDSADQVQTFRQILARGPDGATVNRYRYYSEIFYKETGEQIRVPATGTLESSSTELIVSYRDLGFVKVAITMAPMPPRVVSARVLVHCPASTRPSAKQTFELTVATPTATYFTYTGTGPGDGDTPPYTVDVTYVLDDGQQMSLPQRTDTSATLVVSNPFEAAATTTFVAQADFSIVDKVIVDATYNDAANDLTLRFHGELTSNGGSTAWQTVLRDPQATAFSYVTTVLYKSGASNTSQQAVAATLGGTVLVGVGAVAALEVLLVPNLAPAEFAVVQLEYRTADGTVAQSQNFRVSNTDVSQTFRVLLADPSRRGYRYRYQIVGGTTPFDSGWQDATDTVLMVTRPAGTSTPTTPVT